MTASSSNAVPEQKQPANVEILMRLDLSRDIAALQGKELRLQLTTYAPGAVGTPHSHEGKVEVVYALSGTILEHHRDGRCITYHAGESFAANRDTFHYLENPGDVPAKLLVAMSRPAGIDDQSCHRRFLSTPV